jgi:cyclic beta-1,2-glucan synthetase
VNGTTLKPRGHAARVRVTRATATLENLYPRLVQAARGPTPLLPAAEWMLDNHSVVRRAARVVRSSFVHTFERRLPVVDVGPDAGVLRIEVEALELIRGSDGHLDEDALVARMRHFGEHHEATLAELWALPLVLRLLLLEQLAREGPLLLEHSVDVAVDHRCANAVRSLLLLEQTDWNAFVEEVSEVHQALSEDPSGHYLGMDFETRDRYRRTVEALAQRSRQTELGVARRAIALAHVATERDREPLATHVGYYLLDRGRGQLYRELGLWHLPSAAARPLKLVAYLGAILVIAAAHLLALLLILRGLEPSTAKLVLAELLAVVPALTIGVSLVNWLATLVVPPTRLAKLDFSRGIPEDFATLVVVPGMLNGPHDADALVQRIETHYLTVRDANVELALLTDFGDADEPERDEDAALLLRVRRGIEALNRRYGDATGGPFHHFHRRRVWSPRQRRWMGWERKRGKLEELNQLLRGHGDTSYTVHVGREDGLERFRFVITLDADTVLPLDAARRLIETLAHPLNRPRFDAEGRRVLAGYTVLQPRTETTPKPAPTRFANLFAGDRAFDIYTRAVSNVYQDLFGEGVFVGKGIYDLDAFRASVEGRLPSDRILSHDLIEGVLGRAGLVTDVVVYEDYPAHYLGHSRRLHRWIRGDWQLLPWIGPLVPTAEGWQRNRLDVLARWKLLDNLRRSLVAPSVLGLAIFAWFLLPGPAWVWTLLVVVLAATPMLTQLGGGVLQARPGKVRPAMSEVVNTAPLACGRCLLHLVVLPHEARVAVDAIVRAVTRTAIRRSDQLEWTPAAIAARGAGEPRAIWRELTPTSLLALAVGVGLAFVDPLAVVGASPLLLPWLAAPLVVLWTGRPIAHHVGDDNPRSDRKIDELRLRNLARRTWAYFERVVGPEDHWLPPDHFQEDPKGEVAHRTSPTNIAMGLLSTLAAYDLGYVDLLELVVRLRNTIENLGTLPRHRGHFYNWCDTTTLVPLEPRYVSSVDSGNLAAALLIIEQSCHELRDEARPLERRLVGLRDSFDLLARILADWDERADRARHQVATMREELDAGETLWDWPAIHAALDEHAFEVLDAELLHLFEAERGDSVPAAAFEELRTWAAQVRFEVSSLRREVEAQLPWLNRIAIQTQELGAVPPVLASLLTALRERLCRVPELRVARSVYPAALALLEDPEIVAAELPVRWRSWLDHLHVDLETSLAGCERQRARLVELAERAATLVAEMDFEFLYDRDRELLHIGYDASADHHDPNYYDLLASEARIASLIAIGKGDIPLRHWAKLARPIGRFGGTRALLSWSGTMFEYLMPPLLLDEGEGTLLDVSARAAVCAQIEHGRRAGVPWGVSESGYARFDSHHNYQYRAFGVAVTGFRREIERELVIAPYASLMALRYTTDDVELNLDRLANAGAFGPLGAYEALDYTRHRIPVGVSHVVVRSYMSHHQGMILLALHAHTCDRAMVARAHRHPLIRVVTLLLREREPGRVPVERPQPAEEGPPMRPRVERIQSWTAATGAGVEAQLLGNGRYGALLSSGGAGHSWWQGRLLTRPCEDPVFEAEGFAIDIEDLESGERWQLLAPRDEPDQEPSGREVNFSAHGVHITIHERELVAELSVCVAVEADAELRLLRLEDRHGVGRRLRVRGYVEPVLADAREYGRHPAFAKLFVDSQVEREPTMLVCRRRVRSPDEAPVWLGAMLISDSAAWTGFELDRSKWLGRERGLGGRPRPLPSESTPLEAAIDPCLLLSSEVELRAQGSCELGFVLLAAESRAKLVSQARQLASMSALRRTQLEAERTARERAQAGGEDTASLRRHQRLLSAICFPRPELRAPAEILIRNRRGQPALWRHGISGDWPIVVAEVATVGLSMITALLRAHKHWAERGLSVDLVLLEIEAAGYAGSVRQRLTSLFEREGARVGSPEGGVFVIHGGGLEDDEHDVLLGCAALVLRVDTGDVEAALDVPRPAPLPELVPEGQPHEPTTPLSRPAQLVLDNGHGGFTPDGRAYVIWLDPGRPTPAPWINVLANPDFGCVVSERGAGYTWSENSGLNRLCPWSNDTVRDPPSTSLYLRDELDGEIWSPLPAPAPARAPYEVRHGAGWSRFTHASHGLDQRVEIFVAPDDPVQFLCLRLGNRWSRPRRLTLTLCVEWLLGGRPFADTRLLATEFEPGSEVALAHNPWNEAFAGRWAFAAASEDLHDMTGSREEFFGRQGDRRAPAGLRRIGLSGDISHGADACAALRVHIDLGANEETELHFVLGEAADRERAIELARSCRSTQRRVELREELDRRWDRLLGAVELHSPEPGLDLLANRWLLYQCVSSRLWGRTGFYQSSGAFGFRDQLQDVLALVHAAPELIRGHLLEAARHQFEAGDVQHWWHPPVGQGLRSRCSDDLLWLPLATAAYVEASGDLDVLDVRVPYLDSPPLAPEELERYEHEPRWGETDTLYGHCLRALAHAAPTGAHGLPLIGSCDWNDGFSRVGIAGRGESVWLGWFFVAVADRFAELCDRLGRSDDATRLRERSEALLEPLEQAWDGAWYRRAYDDQGRAIGSTDNAACRIDSIAQSWAVLCKRARPPRARQALGEVVRQLVSADPPLIRLFTPAFEGGPPTLGYIQAYPPGVRENGGQYTHAAIWVAWALAELGECERAWELLRGMLPLPHTRDDAAVNRYRVEPYVVAADVYAEPPHVGRGGWTWYTGAAGWMYRLIIERLVGLHREAGRLTLSPDALPPGWPGCELVIREDEGELRVRIERRAVERVLVDGRPRSLPLELPQPGAGVTELVIAIPGGKVSATPASSPARARAGAEPMPIE